MGEADRRGPDRGSLLFYLNGERVEIRDPDPTLLLVDYLRSTAVGLTGTKKGCGQGGCGACTVMLATWDERRESVQYRSINSCMHPVVALDGQAVTTTEGLGSVKTRISPVQYRIARENGSQCGYCTPGWVMNMTSYLEAQREAGRSDQLTQREIEEIFDGNICRCTGYRPILHAMKMFASEEDRGSDFLENSMVTLVDPSEEVEVDWDLEVGFPDELRRPARPVSYRGERHRWVRPVSLDQLYRLLAEPHEAEQTKLVNGNTEIGIYDHYVWDPTLLIDVAQIPELKRADFGEDGIEIGAGFTYSELLEGLLPEARRATPVERQQGLDALDYMAKRTAGMIVRNAASLAGNTMLVVTHLKTPGQEPFPSDLFTALCAVGASVRIGLPGRDEPLEYPILEFAERYNADDDEGSELRRHGVLLSYRIPNTQAGEYARSYKVAIRHENSHSIVNAGLRVKLDGRGHGDHGPTVESASVVYGGIGPIAFHARRVEEFLRGRPWSQETLAGALERLRADVQEEMERSAERLAGLPWAGFSDAYKMALTESFLYQFFVYVLERVEPGAVPPQLATAGQRYDKGVTRGQQFVQTYRDEYPVSYPFIKLSAFMQATGEAIYTHDIPVPVRGLQAAMVTSARASARIHYRIPDGADGVGLDELVDYLRSAFPGVHSYVTWRDVPGRLNQGGGGDEPLFVPMQENDDGVLEGEVNWFGQTIGLVLADNERLALDVAHYIQNQCIAYHRDDDPVLTIAESHERGWVFKDAATWPVHIWKIRRPGSEFDWAPVEDNAAVGGIDCKVVRVRLTCDAQAHFYMETQSCVVEPGEHHDLVVRPSSQSPDSIQSGVLATLNPEHQPPVFNANDVSIRIKRLGGAYGGKTTRSPFIASVTAAAAWSAQRPVRLALKREVDTATVGKRHPLQCELKLAIGTGADDPDNRGKLVGLMASYRFDGGYTYDCSFTVMDCLQLRSDSAYMIPNYETEGEVYRTNKASNTAYRAFGLIQSMLATEDAIEHAAEEVGMLAEEVRENNLYQLGDTTPYGQTLEHCYMGDVFRYAAEKSEFRRRLDEVREFNRRNRWRKRGICLMPLKYGSGYNAEFLEQGGALIEVFDQDGTVLIHQGGVEMGQGVNTKVTQIASHALNLPLGMVRVAEMTTGVVPNPVSTGASTGTALNGGAVKKAGEQLRGRLAAYCDGLRETKGEAWCRQKGIDYWAYPEGWRATIPQSAGAAPQLVWTNIVKMAQGDRINLSAQVRYRQPGGGTTDTGLVYHDVVSMNPPPLVQNFVGFTYNAACSEVEIDVLTGETFVRRCDVFYDMGKSLNPAIDVGQIEGAFIQGLGYVLTEKTIFQPEGETKGELNTTNTWTYKPPATSTIPELLNVHLYPRDLSSGVPADPNLLFSAKEVGEPPLVLAVSVFIAIKKAILASRRERGIEGWFEMAAPATPEEVRTACRVRPGDLTL